MSTLQLICISLPYPCMKLALVVLAEEEKTGSDERKEMRSKDGESE